MCIRDRYPSVLIVLVIILMVFLVTYVVPTFATLYTSMHAQLPALTVFLIAVGTGARSYILALAGTLVAGIAGFRWWSRREAARNRLDRIKMKLPVAGEIWLKYQVAQLSRILSTLLTGGIPLEMCIRDRALHERHQPARSSRQVDGRHEFDDQRRPLSGRPRHRETRRKPRQSLQQHPHGRSRPQSPLGRTVSQPVDHQRRRRQLRQYLDA